MQSFADFVREYRAAIGKTQDEFAQGLSAIYTDPKDKVSGMTISYWERGVYTPSESKIRHLAEHAPADNWAREFGQQGADLLIAGIARQSEITVI